MIVYTTGYGGDKTNRGDSKPGRLLQLAEELDAVIFDIRHVPWSKAPCWRKASMAAQFGDRYRHIPALGNRNYNGATGDGFDIVDLQYGICQILHSEKPPLLLCACDLHDGCHRNYVAQFLKGYVDDVRELTHWGSAGEGLRLRQHEAHPTYPSEKASAK